MSLNNAFPPPRMMGCTTSRSSSIKPWFIRVPTSVAPPTACMSLPGLYFFVPFSQISEVADPLTKSSFRKEPPMFLTVSPMIVAAAFWSHAADTTRIQDSIKRLGNRSFQEREAAMRWLLERPQAADFVKEALQSQDAEVAKRAAILLEHYDRKPVRDLLTAAKTGRFQQFAHLAGSW